MRKFLKIDKKHIKFDAVGCAMGVVSAMMVGCILLALALLCSCTPTRYVPMETVRTQWRDRNITHTVFDTVADTRLIYVKGDTVIDWRDRWHTHTNTLHDTVTIERTDSISYAVEVPAKLTKWQQTKVDYGGWAMLALAVLILILFIPIHKLWRN